MTARAGTTLEVAGFESPQVAAVFERYQGKLRARLLRIRKLIFETAASTDGVGILEETLKWGQPSYLTPASRSGSTIRIGQVKSETQQYALYFHCQTDLVARFRELYPDTFRYGGNRSIVFGVGDSFDEDALRHCISLALTYHLRARERPASKQGAGATRKLAR